MPTTLRRQLSDSEKQQILSQHRRECFVTGHAIPEGQSIQFDHIRAFAIGGATELDNIAPMCDTHNQQKGTLPLLDFRVKLRLQEFFEGGDTLTLKDLLEFLKKQGDIKSYGSPIISSTGDGVLLFDTPVGRREHVVHKCQITGWHYFYATLPVAVLDSDDTTDERVGLQPRYLIFDKVFDLYRHFRGCPVVRRN